MSLPLLLFLSAWGLFGILNLMCLVLGLSKDPHIGTFSRLYILTVGTTLSFILGPVLTYMVFREIK